MRGKSAATPKRARVIWHDPCQVPKVPANCDLDQTSAAFETSPNGRDGEVSNAAAKGKIRGGARNLASRESFTLSATQVSNLVAANEHACAIGLPFTRMITIHWESAGVALGDMAKATGRFTDLMAKSLARHGNRTAWLWVHENGDGKGGHCHLLVHMPAALVPIICALQLRWLRRITGKPYRARVIHSKPIGGRLGLELGNPDLHAGNLEEVLGYVLKGVDAKVAPMFGLERLELGGRVIGKRCGTSQNIGLKARKLVLDLARHHEWRQPDLLLDPCLDRLAGLTPRIKQR